MVVFGAINWLGIIFWLAITGFVPATLIWLFFRQHGAFRALCKTFDIWPWMVLAFWFVGLALGSVGAYLTWERELGTVDVAGEDVLTVNNLSGRDGDIWAAAISLHVITVAGAIVWMLLLLGLVPRAGSRRQYMLWVSTVAGIFTFAAGVVAMVLMYIIYWVPGFLYTFFVVWMIYVLGMNIEIAYRYEKCDFDAKRSETEQEERSNKQGGTGLSGIDPLAADEETSSDRMRSMGVGLA